MGHNPSLGSVDSDMGYDMGSLHSDLGLLEDAPSLSEVVLANTHSSGSHVTQGPFMSQRPPNPTMQALSSQKREAHNRSPISFREGRRASDTSLTQGEIHWLSLYPSHSSCIFLSFFPASFSPLHIFKLKIVSRSLIFFSLSDDSFCESDCALKV